jgi:hypothetical protein
MKKKKLLGFDLDALLNESLSHLFEVSADESTANMKEKLAQEEAKAKAKNRKKVYSKKESENAGDEGEETPSKPVKIKQEKLPDINAQAIADKLNAIRAGKSLKDKDTMSSLKAYFEKLNGPERIALFAFLAGLEKVLSDGSKDVKTPHSKPFNIDMDQEKPAEKKVQPAGTKNPSVNDSAETPIVVGERADTRSIKAKLWRK